MMEKHRPRPPVPGSPAISSCSGGYAPWKRQDWGCKESPGEDRQPPKPTTLAIKVASIWGGLCPAVWTAK